ncbi:BrnT family toxin [Jiella sp. M17.18]|uniref:BrnT family toxin n=1 Tax=Jiella sp. M17.18 TaxID=3234247 RepID=UPI0034DF2DE4
MKVAGIQWDAGNWPKCGKHGVSREEIETVLRTMTIRIPDPFPEEERYRTAKILPDGRAVFVVFTHRTKDGRLYLRPVSARYMHGKEIESYERAEKALAQPSDR